MSPGAASFERVPLGCILAIYVISALYAVLYIPVMVSILLEGIALVT